MTTINLNELSNKDLNDLRNLHGQYPFQIICYLGDYELSNSPFLKPVIDAEGDEQEAYLIEDRSQLYLLIRDLTKSISESLSDRFQRGLGNPLDDETLDIYNCIDLLKALSELDFC